MNSNILNKLHDILKPYDGICPRNCSRCEDYENAIFLPDEENLIPIHQQSMNLFIGHKDGFYYLNINMDCPYLLKENNKGTCLIYNKRPIDCRIYPFYPQFDLENNSYILLKAGTYCPLANKRLQDMERDVRRVLNVINKLVPTSWKETYNNLNYECSNRLIAKDDNKKNNIFMCVLSL